MRTLLTICLSMLFLDVWPQADSLMAGLGIGMNRHQVLDEFLSPMSYRGNGYMVQGGLHRQKSQTYGRLTLMYQKTRIRPEINNNSSARLSRGSIDWIRTYRLKGGSMKWKTYLGFQLLADYLASAHSEWPNNSYSHCGAISLGPSLTVDYSPWTPDIHFIWEFSVPVLAYIIRPSLGSILPEGSLARSRQDVWGVVSGGSFTSLHEYQRICSNLCLSLQESAHFKIRIGYQWDFQHYTANNHYRSTFHLLYMAVYYRFK